MSSILCRKCNKPLNESQYRTWDDIEYKSCPKCSVKNGQEHVYYEYPMAFGESEKRASSNYPNGPQSYCISCRGRGESSRNGKLCSEF